MAVLRAHLSLAFGMHPLRQAVWNVNPTDNVYIKSTAQNKSGGRSSTAALKFSKSCREREFYDDLYLTEQPYGLVCGVVTDLPAND